LVSGTIPVTICQNWADYGLVSPGQVNVVCSF
jgi:hypothetical protein